MYRIRTHGMRFFKLYISDIVSRQGGTLVSRFCLDSDPTTICYLIESSNPYLPKFLRSKRVLRLMQRFGQFQGFEVMREYGVITR